MFDITNSDSHSDYGKIIDDTDHDTEDGSETEITDELDDNKEAIKGLLVNETKYVCRLRAIVVSLLLISGIITSTLLYVLTKKGETEEFGAQFEGASEKILNSFENILEEVGSISGLGIALSTQSADHESEHWPFVTLTNFQQRARLTRHISKALFVSISPLVSEENRAKWEYYVNGENSNWISHGLKYQEKLGIINFETQSKVEKSVSTNITIDPIHYFSDSGESFIDKGPGPYLPIWQTSPVLSTKHVNENLLSRHDVMEAAVKCIERGVATLGGFPSAPPGRISDPNPVTANYAALISMAEQKEVTYMGDPMAYVYFPIYDLRDEKKRNVVAVMRAIIQWKVYFQNVLPNNNKIVVVVLENTCHGFYTYHIHGEAVKFVGFGDHHDSKFDVWGQHTSLTNGTFDDGTTSGIKFDNNDKCRYHLHIYPSQEFYDNYNTRTPYIITFSVMAVFVFTNIMFFLYDRLVEYRQKIILAKAIQSNAIVSSLFPENVRERLFSNHTKDDKNTSSIGLGQRRQLKKFLKGNLTDRENTKQPIADLFPACTVFFADISGFTSWSSTRDPSQVFLLLQTLYQSFDILAKRYKVFKVETIGDSYVSVTGLPEPQERHAMNMANFAWMCLHKMKEVVSELEVTLGPDTVNLSLRVGLHSGPVTAGVLLGDRARFQLFGDTVNTASRMESTGVPGRIQVSQSTAALITAAGKEHWLTPREDKVHAKGKGLLETFWLAKRTVSESSSSNSDRNKTLTKEEEKKQINGRFIEWMVELLGSHIKKIVHTRRLCGEDENTTNPFVFSLPKGVTFLDEVKEAIKMPELNAKVGAIMDQDIGNAVELDECVVKELRQYVNTISSMYRDNPFHNFEHACHVTQSVSKLIKRIMEPELPRKDLKEINNEGHSLASHLYDYTHGINSDPLTLFAVVFSAFIHDVDHRGISNMRLMEEEPGLSQTYRNKSVAEQNSLKVAWDALMSEQFNNLRCCLFSSKEEMLRFHQLVVNTVLATDIFDKELNDLRRKRWDRAFLSQESDIDLRGTIVIEHIIQASDVAHTMQHWHVYQKWNQCLFKEMFLAFRCGRMTTNPADFWYEGELGFFDNYIIPLAKKLKECNVFSVSSDEYLDYAAQNRAEWKERGRQIVDEMVKALEGTPNITVKN